MSIQTRDIVGTVGDGDDRLAIAMDKAANGTGNCVIALMRRLPYPDDGYRQVFAVMMDDPADVRSVAGALINCAEVMEASQQEGARE